MNIHVDIAGEALLQEELPEEEHISEETLEAYFAHILQEESFESLLKERTAEVGVTFLEPEKMAELNAAYREVSGSTDVLSFPQWDFGSGEDPEWPGDEAWECLPLGDIVISLPDVMAHAREEGDASVRELVLVLTHGLLHLLGYDHGDPQAQQRMFALQERYRRDFFDMFRGKRETAEDVMRG